MMLGIKMKKIVKSLEYKICDLCGEKYPSISICTCFWKPPSKFNGRK